MNDVSCVILNGNFTTMGITQLNEQKQVKRYDSNKCGLNRELGFLSKNALFSRSQHFSHYFENLS